MFCSSCEDVYRERVLEIAEDLRDVERLARKLCGLPELYAPVVREDFSVCYDHPRYFKLLVNELSKTAIYGIRVERIGSRVQIKAELFRNERVEAVESSFWLN